MRLEPVSAGAHPPRVVGTGLLAADVLLDARCPSMGRFHAGGTCGNVLTILGALGWASQPVARLGNDLAGSVIRRDMQAWGVDVSLLVEASSSQSPVYFHWLDRAESGRPIHKFSRECPSCGRILPSYQPVPNSMIEAIWDSANGAHVCFVDRVSRGAITLAKYCREQGALIVFEPSGAGDPRLFAEMISISHIIKYSKERSKKVAPLVNGGADGSYLLIETLGSEGLRYQHVRSGTVRDTWQYLGSAPTPEVRDTAGAGDWCTAGLLHQAGRSGALGFSELPEEAIEQSLMLGQTVAAWNCGFEGARGGMYATPVENDPSRNLFHPRRRVDSGRLAHEANFGPVNILCSACTSGHQ